jgi:hypothetical protein
MWSLKLRDEYKFSAFFRETSVRKFGPERVEVTGEYGKCIT